MSLLMPKACPICDGSAVPLDVVDFNKSCEEAHGKFLPLAGIPIYYYLCEECGFCFAPELHQWSITDFESKIYNDNYILVDPEYLDRRPRINAGNLNRMFGTSQAKPRHLDYGGGNGLLSALLRDEGWRSQSYDPFIDRDASIRDLGKFDLISAFEVFEHVPDSRQLVKDLAFLLDNDGLVVFSTLLSDGKLAQQQRLTWWYASPRNGHISLHSKRSLQLLAATEGFNFDSFSPQMHALWRQIPTWASHLVHLA